MPAAARTIADARGAPETFSSTRTRYHRAHAIRCAPLSLSDIPSTERFGPRGSARSLFVIFGGEAGQLRKLAVDASSVEAAWLEPRGE